MSEEKFVDYMNVGIYSFKREDDYINVYNYINRMILTNNIHIYNENTNKERISKRTELNKMLNDYKNGKIDIILFEDFKSLGNDLYTNGKIIDIFLSNNYKFYCINRNLNNTKKVGKDNAELFVSYTKAQKARCDERSRIGQKIRN